MSEREDLLELLDDRVAGLESEVKLLLDERDGRKWNAEELDRAVSRILDNERGPKVEGEPFAPKVYTRDVYDQYPIHDQICEAVASWKEDYCTVPNVLRLGFMDYAELRKYVGCGLKTKIKEYMGMQVVGTKLIYEICALCEDRSEETDPSCERGSM